MRLKILSKSINRLTGIIVCSVLLLVVPGSRLYPEDEDLPRQDRTFEVQFHSVDISGKLPYHYLNEIGINKVIVRVFQNRGKSGGLYFNNSSFRVITPYLEQLAPEFSSRTLDLYAWMITRRFSWVEDDSLLDYQYHNGSRSMVRKLDIFNPQAIEKIIGIFRELSGKPIRGILLQDDFFLRFNEGFSNWGKAVFTNTTGLSADPRLMMNPKTASGRQWKQVKVNQITRVLGMIVRACREVNPRIKIGMNVYYESPYFIHRSRAWYSHDLVRLANTEIDYIYLMSYHRQMKKEMKLSESQNRELFRKIIENALKICGDKLVVKLQCRDWDTAGLVPLSELKAYLGLIPGRVKQVCLTPVKSHDFYYLKNLIKPETSQISGSADR